MSQNLQVNCEDVRKLATFNSRLILPVVLKERAEPVHCHEVLQPCVFIRISDKETDIRVVAFVARSGVDDRAERGL